MLFTIITLAIVATVFLTLKKRIDKSTTPTVHSPVEEIEVSNEPAESHVEVEEVTAVETVPTTPPSKPTMTAKKKKPLTKKKPNQPK